MSLQLALSKFRGVISGRVVQGVRFKLLGEGCFRGKVHTAERARHFFQACLVIQS